MGLFSKRKAKQRLNDRELIAENSKAVDALIILAGENVNLSKEFKNLQEKLKYLIPSENPDVIEYDEVIKSQLCSLQAFLIKNERGNEDDGENEIGKRIRDIQLAVSGRNTIL